MNNENPIELFYKNNSDLQTTKWNHYLNLYWQYLKHLQNKENNILEIGIRNGGSLLCWKNVFPNSNIIGMDNNYSCKRLEKEYGFNIYIGDQNNEDDLKNVGENEKSLDIIIDDGSHLNDHIIKSFQILFPFLNYGGFYFIEDNTEKEVFDYFKEEFYNNQNICLYHVYSQFLIIKKCNNNEVKENDYKFSRNRNILKIESGTRKI